MPVVWKSIYVKYYVLMTSSVSHQMPLGASILPFFDHLITLLPSYVTTVAGFAIFVTILLCHITALPFLCQILFPSPFWCHCESSLTMSHIKWVIPKNIPISPHRKYSPRHRSLIISSSVNPSYESSLWVNYFWEMNNEPEVVMSSSPISKCQQSKTQSSTSSSTSSSTKKLTLVVDKTRFICNALIFNQHPNTLLGKMFSPHLLNRQGDFTHIAAKFKNF